MTKDKIKLLIILAVFLFLGLIFIYYRSLQRVETVKPETKEIETIQEELPSRERRPALSPEGPVEK